MKFFSNEPRENTDDPGPDEDRDRGDVGVAAVPSQRAGSPWSDAPADAPPPGDPSPGPASPGDGAEDRPWAGPADGQDQPGERPEAAAIRDEGTFDGPTAVEPATGEPPAVATAPVPSTTGTGPAPGRFFAEGDSFNERFRDIQLRFVDSPKEATAEAAALVGEAVDKLTSALRAQRDQLGTGSDDTEKLRVELRGYRDLLGRLTSL